MPEYICPHCGMAIYDEDALLCHNCGESLERSGSGLLGRMRYSSFKSILFFVIFLILFAFVVLMIIYN